jgi:hypothetical protein
VFADQVAGNGEYVLYVTHQINGAGSSYRLIPITTAAAASGATAIAAQSGMIAVRSGDVLTVYLDGLAGDNSTPDTTVRWFELDVPTTAEILTAFGSAGNLDSQLASLPTAAENAAEVDSVLSAAHGNGSWGSGASGSGAIEYTVTVNDESAQPLDGVEVWVTSDSAGTTVVAGTLTTNAAGQVAFMLDAGTYYVWRQLARYNFANPITITVA